jgi:hypothetical protein
MKKFNLIICWLLFFGCGSNNTEPTQFLLWLLILSLISKRNNIYGDIQQKCNLQFLKKSIVERFTKSNGFHYQPFGINFTQLLAETNIDFTSLFI